VSISAQNFFLEMAANGRTLDLKISWFEALLRQDFAFHDIVNSSGTAFTLSANAEKYRRGVGRSLGNGLQYGFSLILSLILAFASSWRVSLVILATLPFVCISMVALVHSNTIMADRKTQNYAQASSMAYGALSSIRTVLALSAAPRVIEDYENAMENARKRGTAFWSRIGLANGMVMASFLLMYLAVTLYGSSLIEKDVRETGCDPSGGVPFVDLCEAAAVDIYGALLAVCFAAFGLPQIALAFEAFSEARAACYPAVVAMKRSLGSTYSEGNLPPYEIDNASEVGRRLPELRGSVEFTNVTFSYPSRPRAKVLSNFCLKIEAGKSCALVGNSGGGKSTVTNLLERFYDPQNGSVFIDGVNIKDLNTKWLRSQIGLVSQEPKL